MCAVGDELRNTLVFLDVLSSTIVSVGLDASARMYRAAAVATLRV
jgi:hypothetical protein